MTTDIAEKINGELAQDIVSERQVVYILVETRKLLEQEKVLEKFDALKLRADWAVHSKLRGPQAQEILKYFDAYEREHRKTGITVAEYDFEPLHEFMAHTMFQAELVESLSPYGVNVDRFAEDVFWQSFIQDYTSVIQDCPLEVVDYKKTEFVTHVSGLAWSKEMAESMYPGKRVIQCDLPPISARLPN